MAKKKEKLQEYTFWIPIKGTGFNSLDAWENAVSAWAMDLPTNPPEPLFQHNEDVPTAEILGGKLSDGFTINNGLVDA